MKEYAEPHFEDEQTILSARPVVPLEQIKAKTRHRRLWLLSGAFVLAMMLGSASALLALYLTRHDVPQTVAELPVEPAMEPASVTVAEATTADTEIVENENPENENSETSEEVNAPPITPKRESAATRRTVAPRHSAHPDEERDTRQLSEDDQLQRIRDAVLYDEWQERRARRVRRERRRAERYNHRDLSNLNEIFEGRRRP